MAIEDQKTQPKKITIDGQTVENRSIDEIRQAESDTAKAAIKARGNLPLKFIKWNFPGSVS